MIARLEQKHASAALLAAMRACPWAYDSAPDQERMTANLSRVANAPTGDVRPACMRWKAGDVVLLPWVRKSAGVSVFYERTGGPRAGEITTAFLPQEARGRIGPAFDVLDALRASYAYLRPDEQAARLDAAHELDDLPGTFRVIDTREAWRYTDPVPGVEAVTCKPCLRLILEVQGARADFLAERAALIATRAVEAELNAQREQALLERGTCPRCSGELDGHDFEGLRVCRPCGFEWSLCLTGTGGTWRLLNSTNR